ncbi:MAG: hypothetical protein ACREMK_04545 [Gemmatimonadota bacterium]
MKVEVALWESDETGERVRLLQPARANVWPTQFHLRPGEVQTVRFLLPEGAYAPDTLLRLETRLVPVPPETQESAEGTSARLIFATRILSKAWVR